MATSGRKRLLSYTILRCLYLLHGDKFLKSRIGKWINAGIDEGLAIGKRVSERSVDAYTRFRDGPSDLAVLSEAIGSFRDAITREKKGTALELATKVSVNVGAGAAMTAALLGAAAMFGTASTGVAIGTLSGAAFTSAALAWLGGSVAVGTSILTGGAILAGIAAVYSTQRLFKGHLYGPPRNIDMLGDKEQIYLDSLDHLLIALKKMELDETVPPSFVSKLMWAEVLNPAISFYDDKAHDEFNDWPVLSKRSLRSSISKLKELRAERSWLQQSAVPIGVVTVVTMRLLAGSDEFTPEDELVLDAFRRSANELENATPEQIGEYLSGFSPNKLAGVKNNVKGIYHELAYAEAENTDGDQYFARVFPDTNHPGADIEIIDATTGETLEVLQLKATNNVQALVDHLEQYQDISVRVTEELSEKMSADSSGFTNAELSKDLDNTMQKLSESGSMEEILGTTIEGSITAGLVTFLCSAGAAIKNNSQSNTDELISRDVRKSMTYGAVAAFVTQLVA